MKKIKMHLIFIVFSTKPAEKMGKDWRVTEKFPISALLLTFGGHREVSAEDTEGIYPAVSLRMGKFNFIILEKI